MKPNETYTEVSAAALAGLIDGALAERSHVLRFPERLEARYRAGKKTDRLRHQRRAGVVGLFFFMTFLISDAVVVPDVFWLGVILRSTCFVVMFAMLAMLQPQLPDWLTNALAASFTLPAIATVAALFSLSRAPDRVAYLNGITVCVTFANICLQQRFKWAAGSNAIMLVVVLVGLCTSHVPPSVQLLQMLLLVTTMALTLMVSHRLEWQSRRSYLLSEQDHHRKAELQRSNDLLTELSERDALTGLANRRRIDRHLQDAWAMCAARSEPVALIMLDVDWFKSFNDTYGHPAGDACLRDIGASIREEVRHDGALAGRYGGEEFIVIMQSTNADAARLMAERLRLAVERLNIPHRASQASRYVTVSLGLASARPRGGLTASDLLQSADLALYTAKQAGRARLRCAPLAAL